jgi:hypothetical protein
MSQPATTPDKDATENLHDPLDEWDDTLMSTFWFGVDQGVTAAAARFCDRAKIDLAPTERNPRVASEFISMLSAEWDDDISEYYPYPDSLESQIENAMRPNSEIVLELWQALEYGAVQKIGKIVGLVETTKFLEENQEFTIYLVESLRDSPLIPAPKKKEDAKK